jgi:hypothetical protein
MRYMSAYISRKIECVTPLKIKDERNIIIKLN